MSTTQRALTDFFQRPVSDRTPIRARTGAGGKPKFVDLFCGVGGASLGAVRAGYDVVLAVDSWDLAIQTHALNHPSAAHMLIELPPSEPLPLPSASEEWHLHGSPPCTKLSSANQKRDGEDTEAALELVRWYVDFALESSASSWSMEQVSMPSVVRLMESYKTREHANRNRVAWTLEDFYDHGVPQHRKRLIAGDPETVARLRRAPSIRRSIRDVVAIPGGDWVRNSVHRGGTRRPDPERPGRWIYTEYGMEDALVSVNGPSHTVTSNNLRWAWKSPETGRMEFKIISPFECALLQCFPSEYRFPDCGKANTQRMVGNALPPVVATRFLANLD